MNAYVDELLALLTPQQPYRERQASYRWAVRIFKQHRYYLLARLFARQMRRERIRHLWERRGR